MEDTLVELEGFAVKINNLFPWQNIKNFTLGCTGFCMMHKGKKYIVTNDHCVKQLTVLYSLRGEYSPAKCIFSSKHCDLALYESDLCDKLKPVEFANVVPDIGETLYLYSVHERNINITNGALRAVQMVKYPVDYKLSLYIDAQILPGDSGGPVLNKSGKLIGVIFYGTNIDYTGFAVSAMLIQNFLDRYDYYIKYGKEYDLISLSIYSQTLSLRPHMKNYYGLSSNQTGIRVAGSYFKDNFVFKQDIVRINDIMISINNYPISDDGTIRIPTASGSKKGINVPLNIYFSTCVPGTRCKLNILRQKQILSREFIIPEQCVPIKAYRTDNDYIRWAGMVYCPLTFGLIFELYEANILTSQDHYDLLKYIEDTEFNSIEPIYLLNIIRSSALDMYHVASTSIVNTVNGTRITCLKHLKDVLDGVLTTSEYIVIDMHISEMQIVINSSLANQLDKEIYF